MEIFSKTIKETAAFLKEMEKMEYLFFLER
jgi:hypothetical protein